MAGDSIRVRARAADGSINVRVLVRHPMDNGRREADGSFSVPPHHITELSCWYGDELVLQTAWGPGVAKNPYVAFDFLAAAGGTLRVRWQDNLGGSDERSLPVN